MNSVVLIDEVPHEIGGVLRDPVLYALLSDELGAMQRTAYETGCSGAGG